MIPGRDALSRHLKRTAALALLLALTPAAAAAQQGRLATGNWTRGLVGGWGHSWTTYLRYSVRVSLPSGSRTSPHHSRA